MSGNKLFVDTNIILYLLSGDKTLAELLHEKELFISFVTQLELLGYRGISEKDLQILEEFLSHCIVIDINNRIKTEVIKLRKNYSIKLPDCIIIASASYLNMPLITADSDFKKVEGLNLVYYEK
jgi:predicted nucleic acid-binding protein